MREKDPWIGKKHVTARAEKWLGAKGADPQTCLLIAGNVAEAGWAAELQVKFL